MDKIFRGKIAENLERQKNGGKIPSFCKSQKKSISQKMQNLSEDKNFPKT
jgi:hypothetical protein